jgi:hypothetical protein
MNYKIAKTMLGLCIGYLAVFYVLKFFFPELLLQVIASPTLIRLGEFIGIWVGFEYIVMSITLYITYYLFACASSGKFKFSWHFHLIIGIAIVISHIFADFLPELYTHTTTSIMLILSVLAKGNIKYTTISFVIHGYMSQFLLAIRGFETVLIYVNAVSGILFNLEAFVWMFSLAVMFYLKEKNYGKICTPLHWHKQEEDRKETFQG